MPLERREILFSLSEIKTALMAIDNGIRKIPVTHDMTLIEAVHTRDMQTQFHVVRDRYAKIYKDVMGKDGVMFRASQSGNFGMEKHAEFFVPEAVMLEAVLHACRDAKIMAPRTAHKEVITENLMVGIKFEVVQSALMLEDAF